MKDLNLTSDMLAKAKAAANADELLTLAKAANIDLTVQEAQAYFKALHDVKCGELSEAELDKVAGGDMFIKPHCSTNLDPDC